MMRSHAVSHQQRVDKSNAAALRGWGSTPVVTTARRANRAGAGCDRCQRIKWPHYPPTSPSLPEPCCLSTSLLRPELAEPIPPAELPLDRPRHHRPASVNVRNTCLRCTPAMPQRATAVIALHARWFRVDRCRQGEGLWAVLGCDNRTAVMTVESDRGDRASSHQEAESVSGYMPRAADGHTAPRRNAWCFKRAGLRPVAGRAGRRGCCIC
jgi:hypothetical protein